MKILLDENLPQKLRTLLSPMHEPYTVGHLGWKGIGNGKLLALAASNGFEVLITTDKGVQYQQNLQSLPCSIIVLGVKSNKLDDIKPILPKLMAVLVRLTPRSVIKIG